MREYDRKNLLYSGVHLGGDAVGGFRARTGSDPKGCSDAANSSSGQSLSNRLSQTNGVICPPNGDPGIKAPTPDTGKTPIIPPPGSPGGNPNVQPK